MKKLILFFVMIMAALTQVEAQSNCNFNLTDYWTTLSVCSPSVVTVSGQTSLTWGGGSCAGSRVTVQLQRLFGTVWSTQTSTIVYTGLSSGTYSFSISTSGEYRIVGSPTSGAECAGCGFPSFIKTSQTVTISTAPSSTYNIDGATVNSSTYLQTYECKNLQMTNITWAGSNSINIPGVTPAATYQWKVDVTRNGTYMPGPWNSGTPGTSFNLKGYLTTLYGASSLAASYNIQLVVRNSCNTSGVAYSGLIQILGTPTAPNTTVTLYGSQSSNGTSSGTYSNVSSSTTTQATPLTICGMALYYFQFSSLTGSVTSYIKKLDKLVMGTWVNVYTSPVTNITALPLGQVLIAPYATLATLVDNVTYRVTVELSNQCTGATPVIKTQYFKILTACKTDGTETATGINEAIDETLLFTVYPNPASTQLTIEWNPTYPEPAFIKMYGLDGKEISVEIVAQEKGQAMLNTAALAKGIYVIELNNGSRNLKKVVIE